jgi:threonyl-tRNA synthetase
MFGGKHHYAFARLCGVDDAACVGLQEPLATDCRLELLTAAGNIQGLAHSAAHTLGHAIEQTFDGALLVDGPAASDGTFYYDCTLPSEVTVTAEHLPLLHTAMKDLIASRAAFEYKRVAADDAAKLFAYNPHKIALIREILNGGRLVGVYRCGDFVDLCRGPHVPSLSALDASAIHLYRVGGTHVRSEHRVGGIALLTRAALDAWRAARDAAAECDHRVVGRKQELFMFTEHSPGSVTLLPHGARIRNALIRALRREYRVRGFDEVVTPQLFDAALWQRSGHWQHYRNDMFRVSPGGSHAEASEDHAHVHQHDEHNEVYLKPMNCPAHCLIFGQRVRSHR